MSRADRLGADLIKLGVGRSLYPTINFYNHFGLFFHINAAFQA
jgi:hypothetical protein